jgi:hypothetical protein
MQNNNLSNSTLTSLQNLDPPTDSENEISRLLEIETAKVTVE